MEYQDEQGDIELGQGADRQAFAALVERYWGRVFRWLAGLTRHEQLAEDLTQEAFLRAWRALPSFRSGADFRPWLFGIARNCFIDWQRGAKPASSEARVEALPSRAPGPVQAALEREGEGLLHAACGRLPIHFRAPFLLWAQEGLSFAEVAQALALTEETARWRVYKARLLLLRELRKYLDGKMP